MFRRRRRQEKEIAFSFDSFLDLVANVVGIIIRLILVAWVGARTYTGVVPHPAVPAPEAPAGASRPASVQSYTHRVDYGSFERAGRCHPASGGVVQRPVRGSISPIRVQFL